MGRPGWRRQEIYNMIGIQWFAEGKKHNRVQLYSQKQKLARVWSLKL
jgi:hypothetical protein